MEDKARRAYLMGQLVILRERHEKVAGAAAPLMDQAEIARSIALLSIAYDLARLSDGGKVEIQNNF